MADKHFPSVRKNKSTPSKLYKYRAIDENLLNSLLYGELWFAAPHTFNDPFDCNTPSYEIFKYEESSLFKNKIRESFENGENLFEYFDNEIKEASKSNRFTRRRILVNFKNKLNFERKDFREKTEFLRLCNLCEGKIFFTLFKLMIIEVFMEKSKDFLENISHNTFILSLSYTEIPENNLLWAHYAQGHTGCALGFDFKAFDSKEVNYLKKEDRDNEAIDNIWNTLKEWYRCNKKLNSTNEHEQFYEQLKHYYFLTKNNDWAYENEYRSFVNKQDGDSAKGKLVRFKEKDLKSVHFGVKCDKADIFKTKRLFDKVGNYEHIKFYRGYRGISPYTIIFAEIEIDIENKKIEPKTKDGISITE